MKDDLRDFIQANRDKFDMKEVPENAWHNIQRKLFGKQVQMNALRYWQAAAVFFFILSGYLLLQDKIEFKQTVASKEFADTEAFYNQQISEKMQLIHAANSNNGAELTQDFQQLEAMYMVLKEEMNLRPSAKVKDAMILNLLVRINLLNKQLQSVEQVNSTSNTVES